MTEVASKTVVAGGCVVCARCWGRSVEHVSISTFWSASAKVTHWCTYIAVWNWTDVLINQSTVATINYVCINFPTRPGCSLCSPNEISSAQPFSANAYARERVGAYLSQRLCNFKPLFRFTFDTNNCVYVSANVCLAPGLRGWVAATVWQTGKSPKVQKSWCFVYLVTE